MKAITHVRYGAPDSLVLREVDRPVPGPDGILVRVRAASVNAFDWHLLRGHPYVVRASAGFRRPTRLVAGVDFAGEVEAVGSDVTAFQPGDRVFGEKGGAFAEYIVATAESIAPVPADVGFEAAAAIPMAGFTALQALRDKAGVTAGQRVLVNGAGGGVGTFAVQLAKHLGAHVTGVTGPATAELVRSLGADEVIDYSREDFTRRPERWDVIIDIAATPSLVACRRALAPGGVLVVVGAPPGNWVAPIRRPLLAVLLTRLGGRGRRLLPFLAERRRSDLDRLAELVEAGAVRPAIDRCYPLAEAADAIRRVERGEARGKVVITM